MKRAINIVLVWVMVTLFTFTAFADTGVLSLTRAAAVMPELTVEVKGSGYDAASVFASLGSENLTVEDVHVYDKAVDSTRAYILVDLSTSMRRSFDLVKNNIIAYINSMGANDKLVLITFGETEVKTLLSGNEDRATAISTVQALAPNENGTMFYEALSQAYKLSTSSTENYSREYIIAFSDGIDVQSGNTTFDEVADMYDGLALPIYASCSINSSSDAKEGSDRFGELARTSGGAFSFIDSEATFTQFVNEINNVTLIKLKAATNHADGKEKQLTLKIGDLQVEYNVPITRSTADTVAPSVEELYYDTDNNIFVVSFSEKVLGALSETSYKITDAEGNNVVISDIYYSEEEGRYEISPETQILNSTYTVAFSGITDDSQELNSLKETGTVEVTDVVIEKEEEGLSIWVIVFIILGVMVLALIVVIIIVAFSKKSENATIQSIPVKGSGEVIDYVQNGNNEIKHHIKTSDAVRIKLKIKTGKMSEQNIETNVLSSVIIGRSNVCDIYIDDAKLSRQHFVIENDNGRFFIMDLQSRNGTMLNGIRVESRRELHSGDKILAGLSDIIIVF